MGGVAGSGRYFVAIGADTIVAQPGTLTGWIGVFGGKVVATGGCSSGSAWAPARSPRAATLGCSSPGSASTTDQWQPAGGVAATGSTPTSCRKIAQARG